MQLESVNLGQEQILQNKSRVERTGIFKFPVEGPVRVTTLSLEGDAILSKDITVDLTRLFMCMAERIMPGGQKN